MAYHPKSPFLISPTTFYDNYNLTMAAVDFLEGEIDKEVVAQITFRNLMNSGYQISNSDKPQKIPFYIFAGLEPLMQSLSEWGFTEKQLERLAAKKIPGTDQPLLPPGLIEYWSDPEKVRLRVSITAREEGRLAFPHEPLLIIKGPKWQVDLIEAAADNLIKNHTKTATIAAEFWLAAESALGRRPALLDGSARRAAEWAGLGVARSAYIAGWAGTSNEFAGEVFDIPTGGTLAHSFYMEADSEEEANRKWIRHMPPASLPDTYNTYEGMQTHLRVCKEMGKHPTAARNDSDDPEWFIKTYSSLMEESGFDPKIVNFTASNNLSVMEIYEIIRVKDLPYNSFIIGTHIGNHVDDPTEATVQKLAQVTGVVDGEQREEPRDVMKIAKGKSSFPGVQTVVHMYDPHSAKADLFRGSVIVPENMAFGEKGHLTRELISIPHPKEDERPEEGAQPFVEGMKYQLPNVKVMEDGKPLLPEYINQDSVTPVIDARKRFFEAMESLAPQHKKIINPVPIGYGVEESLFSTQSRAIRNETLRAKRLRETAKLGFSVLTPTTA